MSSYHEAVKRILSEFNRYLKITLQSETLSPSAEKDRKNIIKLLQKLFADYDTLAPSSGDEGSVSSSKDAVNYSMDESRNTVDSSHGSEEDGYADNIPDVTVQALSEPSKMGYLDRRQEYVITSAWHKRYCVLHKNIFYIFKKPGNKKQQGAFFVTGYELREAPQWVKEERKKDCCFELVCPGKKSYQFLCESKDDLQSWREVIEAASSNQPARDQETDGDIYEGFDENAGSPLTTVEKHDDTYDDTVVDNPPPKPKGLPILSRPGLVLHTAGSMVKETHVEEDADNMIYEPIDPITSPGPPKKNLGTLMSASSPPPPPVQPHSSRVPPPPVPSPKESEPPHVPPQRESQPPALPPGRRQELPPPQEPVQVSRPLPPPPTDPLPPVPQTPKKMTSPNLGKILHPSEDFENLFFGKWDCTGTTDNELTFRRGQIVHVISRDLDKDDWWIGALDDKVGLVPKNYLSPAYEQVR